MRAFQYSLAPEHHSVISEEPQRDQVHSEARRADALPLVVTTVLWQKGFLGGSVCLPGWLDAPELLLKQKDQARHRGWRHGRKLQFPPLVSIQRW